MARDACDASSGVQPFWPPPSSGFTLADWYLWRGFFRLSPRCGTKRAEACTLEVLIALFQAVTKFRKNDKDGPSHLEISILTMGMVAHNGLLR